MCTNIPVSSGPILVAMRRVPPALLDCPPQSSAASAPRSLSPAAVRSPTETLGRQYDPKYNRRKSDRYFIRVYLQ